MDRPEVVQLTSYKGTNEINENKLQYYQAIFYKGNALNYVLSFYML